MKFEVIYTEEAMEFLNSMPASVRTKMYYNIAKVANGNWDATIFKKLGSTEIWEFITEYSKIEYRLLSFWDKTTNSLVVATHGFMKKTQKTPKKEIERAESIRKLYFENNEKV